MLNVLYVEDDMLSRQIMQTIIENRVENAQIVIFADSENFARRVQSLDPSPDVFLLDIHVEPYSGFEMIAMLRANPKHAQKPIIALTASVMNEEVHRLRDSGFDGAIAKPVSIQTFPDLLRRIVRGESVWHIV